MRPIEEIALPGVMEWLLEPENPSVRYFTLTTLLNKPAAGRDVTEARQAIMHAGPVPEILAMQREDGYWKSPDQFYTAKYTGTVWQLMILAELGADGADPRIQQACEFILNFSREKESGGFAYRTGKREGGGLKSEVIPCLTGNLVWSLIRHGWSHDPRVQRGIDWICRYQRTDDGEGEPPAGWPYDRYEMCWGRHTCHMGVAKSLKALSALPETERSSAVNRKIGELSEFLLKHHIYKRSHNLGKISKPGWSRFGFPLMYQTDILEILDIMASLGIDDPRMEDAITLLLRKRTTGGKWVMENSFNGKMITNIESLKKESKWITLKALSILLKH
ncbi:MAG TPA: hypothetical protein PKG48_14325 [Bacteroidales bacterium]|nr:hypothetical protein [Bacteroidales bacterium]